MSFFAYTVARLETDIYVNYVNNKYNNSPINKHISDNKSRGCFRVTQVSVEPQIKDNQQNKKYGRKQ